MDNILKIFLYVLLVQIVVGISFLDKEKNLLRRRDQIDRNLCSKLERYLENVTTLAEHTYEESYNGNCYLWRCTKYRNVTKWINKTRTIMKTRTVFDCCPGTQRINRTCMAICEEGCVHGICTKPRECSCDRGWKGTACNETCEDGRFGSGCEMFCSCENGAPCDKTNGTCYCAPGFTGLFCESTCGMNSYGSYCENQCKCMNGAICNVMNGSCDCMPGYVGPYCENECEPGKYGKSCNNNCSCIHNSTEMCSHIDGGCFCQPGFKGTNCEGKCEKGSWGARCEEKCYCGPNSTCNVVNGECSCPPGWHGRKCTEKCPVGYFEKDCKMRCPDCRHSPGVCHHETGWCNCPPGATGKLCDLECSEGTYGKDCKQLCLCSNNSTCNSVDGSCICLAGWTGEDCSLPCPDGTFGLNCSGLCNCTSCDNVNGECQCEDGSSCLLKQESFTHSRENTIILSIVVGACLLGFVLFTGFIVFIFKRTATRVDIYRRFCNPTYDNSETMVKQVGFSRPVPEGRNAFEEDPRNDNPDSLCDEEFGIPECDKDLNAEKAEICFDKELESIREKNIEAFVRYSNAEFNRKQLKNRNEESEIYADVDLDEEHHYERPSSLENTK